MKKNTYTLNELLDYANRVMWDSVAQMTPLFENFRIELVHDHEFMIVNNIDDEKDFFLRLDDEHFVWSNNYSDSQPNIIINGRVEFNDEEFVFYVESEEK